MRHRRLGAARAGDRSTYEFRHRLFMAYLDLDELPRAVRRRPALLGAPAGARLVSPRRPPRRPRARRSRDSVRELVAERTGRAPGGPIGLLTHLRCFGHCFNPVSFYYCFEAAAASSVQAVVAHVTNTPWGESHSYVLDAAASGRPRQRDGSCAGAFEKQLHVSPLMGMDHSYDCA